MKSYWTIAALLSLVIAAGCADRGDNSQNRNTDEQAPAGAQADAPAVSSAPAYPAEDGSAARPEEGSRATAGTRASRPANASPSARQPVTPRRPGTAAPEHDPATERALAESTARRAAPAPRVPEWKELTVPQGTALPLELETALSSETAQVETPVRARLRQAVVVDGHTVIPAGAIMTGEVTEVERAGRVKGRSRISFTFNNVEANNVREDLKTNPLTFVGEASKGADATKVGAGAVGGAIIGGILGGKDGAAKGAAVGGAAGTGVVLATRGKEVTLAPGADLAASLAEPFTIRVEVR
jgi:hypothetical protein